MTNKEYRNRLNNHKQFTGYDMLTKTQRSELVRDITERKHNGEIILDGFNKRASIKKRNEKFILTSYYTDVCSYSKGKFRKLWHGYSSTTLKHINIFRKYLGLEQINKREWVEM